MFAPRLTEAQTAALALLATAPSGKLVEGWKRSTATLPIARVNIKAVATLVRLGLAERHMRESRFWCPYTHDERYTITDAGRARLSDGEA